MGKSAAVTICSINYVAKALVLFNSYKKHHESHDFYVLIVDKKRESLQLQMAGVSLIWVEDLQIDNFSQHAFAFDVIEFNTNVKPTILRHLLADYENVVYLDPDIKVYAPLEPVFDALSTASIVVTPHSNTPVLDGHKPGDLELLRMGVYNLGFVAVSQCEEAVSFLTWWSDRCLEYGFYEPQSGLAVDQKWVNLAPCYFPNLQICHDIGLNVAFWNLHERQITDVEGELRVNGDVLLRFIHFSSFDTEDPHMIARKQTRFASGSRPDFDAVSEEYAAELLESNSEVFSENKYAFDYFQDGTYISPALRRFYAALRITKFCNVSNPFEAEGPVKSFAKRNGLLTKGNVASPRHSFRDMDNHKWAVKIILIVLRLSLRLLGPNRYFAFMTYLAHISSLRNQTEMFGRTK